jgi:tetratricopeptide (TPR) repeat protein
VEEFQEADEAVETIPEVQPSAASRAPEPSTAAAQSSQLEETLEQARQALSYEKFADAAKHYKGLVKKGKLLDEVVADLEGAVSRHPRQLALWQALGDAYMRADRLRDALDSYTKAEELL